MQAKAEGLSVASVPIQVNPHTRPSRLAKSMWQYLRRSGGTIVRSFALYYPFRFFFWIGIGAVRAGHRRCSCAGALYWLFEDPYRSRIPSLVMGSVLVIVAVQIWVVAFLADLQAAARRLLAEARARDRKQALGLD